MKKTFYFSPVVLFFLLLFVSITSFADPDVARTIERLNASNGSVENCAPTDPCPTALTEAFADSKSNSAWAKLLPFIGKKTPYEHCTQTQLREDNFVDGATFERFLTGNEDFNFNAESSISGRQCYAGLNSRDQKYLVGLNYTLNARLQNGMNETIEGLANIDRVLGKNVLNSVDCNKLGYASSKATCEEAKACPNPTYSLDDMVERGNIGFQIIQEKQNRLADIVAKKGLPAAGADPEVKKIEEEIRLVREIYPWLKGDEVKNKYSQLASSKTDNERKSRLKGLITADLLSTQERLKQKLNEEKKTQTCLRQTTSADCDDVLNTISKTPQVQPPKAGPFSTAQLQAMSAAEKNNIRKNLSAGNYINTAQCMVEMTRIRNETVSELKFAAVDAGVTLALSLTPYALVNIGKLGMRAAAISGLAVDAAAAAGYAGYSFTTTVQSCQSSLERQTLDQEADSTCSKNKNPEFVAAHFEFEQCALSALASGASLVPLATLGRAASRMRAAASASARETGAITQTAYSRVRSRVDDIVQRENAGTLDDVINRNFNLSDAERRAKIKELFPNYTDEQLDAVMKAHNVGSGNYTTAELREKSRILQQAGISSEDRQVLQRLGLAGMSDKFRTPYRADALFLERDEILSGGSVYKMGESVLIPRSGGGYSLGRIAGRDSRGLRVYFQEGGNSLEKSVDGAELLRGIKPGDKVQVMVDGKLRDATVSRINSDGNVDLTSKGLLRTTEIRQVNARDLRINPAEFGGAGREVKLANGEFMTGDGSIYRTGQKVTVQASRGFYKEGQILGPASDPNKVRVFYSLGTKADDAGMVREVPRSEIFSPFQRGDEVLINGRNPGDPPRRARILYAEDGSSKVKVEIPDRFGPGTTGIRDVDRSELRYEEMASSSQAGGRDSAGAGAGAGARSSSSSAGREGASASSGNSAGGASSGSGASSGPRPSASSGSSGGSRFDPQAEARAKQAIQKQVEDARAIMNEQQNRIRMRDAWRRKVQENPSDARAQEKFRKLDDAVRLTEEQVQGNYRRAYQEYRRQGGQQSENDFIRGLIDP